MLSLSHQSGDHDLERNNACLLPHIQTSSDPHLLGGGAHARRRESLPQLLSRGGDAHARWLASPDRASRVVHHVRSRSSLIQRAETMNTVRLQHQETGLVFSWSQALSPLRGHTRATAPRPGPRGHATTFTSFAMRWPAGYRTS